MTQINIPKFFKDFVGTKGEFLNKYNALPADSPIKSELNNSLVFIHSAGINGGSCIFANGVFYEMGGGAGGGAFKIQKVTVEGSEVEISNEVLKALTDAQINAAIDASLGEAGTHDTYSPSNGDLCIVEVKSEGTSPVRPVTYITYVYDAESADNHWHQVDVAAEHVYFYDGIHRTETWGSQQAGSIQTECTGMNLKQLLEYYLVNEVYPSLTSTWGNTSWKTLGVTNATDGALTFTTDTEKALPANNTVVDLTTNPEYLVGATARKDYKVTNTTTTFGSPSVSGMTYGYYDGNAKVDSDTYTGNTVTGTISYDVKSGTGDVSITFDKGNFSGSLNDVTEKAVKSDTEATITAEKSSIKPVEGVNTVKATYTNNLVIESSNTSVTLARLKDCTYYSNADNNGRKFSESVNDPSVVTNDKEIKYTGTETKPTTTRKEISRTIYGVYPIYTNGTNDVNQTGKSVQAEGSWADAADPNKGQAKYNVLTNYALSTTNSTTIYVTFGNTNDTDNKRIVYIPATMYTNWSTSSSKITAKEYDPNQKDYTSDATSITVNTTQTTIGGFRYYSFEVNKNAGANHWKIIIKKQ